LRVGTRGADEYEQSCKNENQWVTQIDTSDGDRGRHQRNA
jgi:hypothetical protein